MLLVAGGLCSWTVSRVRTVTYFQQRAAECRIIARQLSDTGLRNQLLRMAQEWEALATEREAELRNQAPASAAKNEAQPDRPGLKPD
jgi:hypothetical protein